MKEAIPVPDVAGDKAPKGTALHKPIPKNVGFSSSMKVWEEVILPVLRGSGVTPKEDETDDLLPMVEVDVP